MTFAKNLWQSLRRGVSAALFPRYWMAVIVQEPLRLVLSSDGREVTADGTAATVTAAGKTLARFDAVLSIDIVHHVRNEAEHKPEHWSVTLYLGRSQRAFIGRSRKLAQAEKAAKLLATITGKPQRTLEVLGPHSHISTR